MTAAPPSTSCSISRCWPASSSRSSRPVSHTDSLAAALPDNATGLVGPALLIAPIVLLVLNGLAGQDDLPRRPRRAVPAGADLLHRAAVRRHDHRAEAADRRGVGRSRGLEVRQALLQRRSRRWSATARPCRSSGSSGRTTATSRATCGHRGPPTSWRMSTARFVEIVAPLILLFSTNMWLTVVAALFMVVLPPVHHLDLPARGAAGVERAVRLRHDLPVPRLPDLARLRRDRHVLAVAARRDRRGAAVLPDPGQPAPGQGVVPAVDAPVRRQLGIGDLGVRPGRGGQAEQASPAAPRNQIDQFVAFGYEPAWAEITLQQTIAWRTMHSQGRGLFSVLLKHLPDIDTRTVREAEFVCNSMIGFNFGDGHLHDEDLIAAVQQRGRLRAGRIASSPGSSRRPSAAGCSTTRSSTPRSA